MVVATYGNTISPVSALQCNTPGSDYYLKSIQTLLRLTDLLWQNETDSIALKKVHILTILQMADGSI